MAMLRMIAISLFLMMISGDRSHFLPAIEAGEQDDRTLEEVRCVVSSGSKKAFASQASSGQAA